MLVWKNTPRELPRAREPLLSSVLRSDGVVDFALSQLETNFRKRPRLIACQCLNVRSKLTGLFLKRF